MPGSSKQLARTALRIPSAPTTTSKRASVPSAKVTVPDLASTPTASAEVWTRGPGMPASSSEWSVVRSSARVKRA
ncbi:hypothetical protein [Corynebacterium gottingense]|uniref:hypothetical protein n=1 Tax=Corynebacterium gottingense TaxID=2041036 RepID=UPI0025B5C228|nr:hypothetical protein [Corynebacterium gottingense]